MSKDLVRLLKLQTVVTSAPPPSHGGIDESFGVIRQELDALASKVNIVSQHTDELEREVLSQADELGALRRALEEREDIRRKLESVVSKLEAQLYHGLNYSEEDDTGNEQGAAQDMPIASPPGPNFEHDPIVYNFYVSPETGFPENLNIKHVPTKLKQEGTDWFAVFNPKVKQVLDIALIRRFDYESQLRCVRLSQDMKYLAVACGTTVHVYDAQNGREIWICHTNKAAKSVCFSPDSGTFAVGSNDGQVHIWEIATRELRYTFSESKEGITSVCFSSDGKSVVSVSYKNTARLWSLLDGTCKTIGATAEYFLSVATFANELLALGCRDGSIEVWEVKGSVPKLIVTILGHESAVRSLAFIQPTGNGLLTASDDKSLKHWNLSPLLDTPKALEKFREGGGGESVVQCEMRFTGHKGSITSLAISHDSQWVVSGSHDHCIQFWDLKTATLHGMIKAHRDIVTSVDLSQTGNVLVTGSKDGQVRMWAYK